MRKETRMNSPYLISLDIDNEDLRKLAMAFIMKASFIEQLCIIEQRPNTPPDFLRLPFQLIIFDRDGDYDDITQYCVRRAATSPKAVFIHIGSEPTRCDALHLVGVSKEFFTEYFVHLVGLCFLTHSVKQSMSNVKEMLIHRDE